MTYQPIKYKTFKALIESAEHVFESIYGFPVAIVVRTQDEPHQAFMDDVERIRERVRVLFDELDLPSKYPDMDKYYIALKLVVDKYPFLIDRAIGKAFGKHRSTIPMGKVKIIELLQFDDVFRSNYEKVLNALV